MDFGLLANKRGQISPLSRKFEFPALFSKQLIQTFCSGEKFDTFFGAMWPKSKATFIWKWLYLHQIWFECLQSSFVCLPWHWLLAGLACVLHPFPGLFPGRWNWKQISSAVKGQFFVGDLWWSLWLWSPFWNWTFLNPRCLQLQRVRTLYVAPSVPKLKRKNEWMNEWMNEYFWTLETDLGKTVFFISAKFEIIKDGSKYNLTLNSSVKLAFHKTYS